MTCSSTDRRAERTAIHIEMNGSCPPSAASSWGRTPRTDAKRAFECSDHIGDRDRVGGPGEQPAAIAAADAAHEFTVAELAEDVEQESGWHVVPFGEDGTGDGPTRIVAFEDCDRGHHPHAVVDLVRDPHQARPYQP